MKIKTVTFEVDTPAQLLKKIQAEFGGDAMVINTKELRKKSLTEPALYEVVVAIKSEEREPLERESEKLPDRAMSQDNELSESDDDVLLNLSKAVRQIKQISEIADKSPVVSRRDVHTQERSVTEEAQISKAKQRTKISDNEEDFKELKLIKNEIGKLTDKIKLLQNMVWDGSENQRGGLVIPNEFAEIYRIAKNSGMSKNHLDEIMKLTLEHMPLKMRESSETIKRYFQVLLRKMIPTRMETNLNTRTKKIMMLVGPTGVGKTTTLAKLAARYSYMLDKKYKVGIVTLDTYRIAAVEQLMQYAKMMRLGIEAVVDPPEFVSAINSLRHCDYILIDTVGSSQHDKDKIDKLREFISQDLHTSIDVNLVISANTKFEDLKEIYESFSILNIDTFIITKLDETRGFGNIFSIIYDTKKPINYFSVGQEVPDDLMLASSDFLVECLLGGFKKVKK
jgi:flagellar biosynthesis protein FlhF